jgi:hypothetical protein
MFETIKMTRPHGGRHAIGISDMHIDVIFEKSLQTVGILGKNGPMQWRT